MSAGFSFVVVPFIIHLSHLSILVFGRLLLLCLLCLVGAAVVHFACVLSRKGLLLAEKLAICVHFYILVFLFSEGFTYVLMIILVSVVAQIGPKGSCAVHMNRPQPATSVGYSIYLKKNYR